MVGFAALNPPYGDDRSLDSQRRLSIDLRADYAEDR
jgi:hypothetical protein